MGFWNSVGDFFGIGSPDFKKHKFDEDVFGMSQHERQLLGALQDRVAGPTTAEQVGDKMLQAGSQRLLNALASQTAGATSSNRALAQLQGQRAGAMGRADMFAQAAPQIAMAGTQEQMALMQMLQQQAAIENERKMQLQALQAGQTMAQNQANAQSFGAGSRLLGGLASAAGGALMGPWGAAAGGAAAGALTGGTNASTNTAPAPGGTNTGTYV